MRLLGSKYAKNAFAAGAPPRTRSPGRHWGAQSAPPDPLAEFGGSFAAGRRERRGGERKGEEGREEKGKKGTGRERRGGKGRRGEGMAGPL